MAGTLVYQFGDGAFIVEVHFNDALRVDRITATNASGGAGSALLTRTDTGTARPAYELTSPAGSGALFVVVPTTALLRLQLTEIQPGKFDGLEGFIEWAGSGATARRSGSPLDLPYPSISVQVTAADGTVTVNHRGA